MSAQSTMETGKTNIRIKGQIMFSVAIILSGILFLFNFWFIFNSQNCLKASTGYFIEVMTNIVWRRHRNRFTWSFIKNKRRWLGSWYLKRQGDKLPLLRLSRTPSLPPPLLHQQGFVQIWCCHFVGLLCQGRAQSTVDCRPSALCWLSNSRWSFYCSSFCCWNQICALRIFNVLCKWICGPRSKRLIYLFTFRCSTTWGLQYQKYTSLTEHFVQAFGREAELKVRPDWGTYSAW